MKDQRIYFVYDTKHHISHIIGLVEKLNVELLTLNKMKF